MTWLQKDEGHSAEEAFKDAFERNKREGLFRGLDELRESWAQLSETGSHATLSAICDRFEQNKEGDRLEWRLVYTGGEPRMWGMSLFSMLLTCFTMERTMYADYESRLSLDGGLGRMRAEFETYKERLRRQLISRYNLKPPTSNSPIRTI